MATRLETDRLIIRSCVADDAGAWLALASDPEVTRFLPAAPTPTLERAHQVIEDRRAMEREHGFAMYAVEEKVTGSFVGQCGIRPVEEGAGPEVDLAYHFSPLSWNKGFASEAVVAVLAHGLGTLGLDKIMAVVVPENVGSWRVMEKAGMRYEGLVDYYGLRGVKKYVAARDWWQAP